MKINRALLSFGNTKTFEDSIDFFHAELNPSHIRKIEKCDVVVTANDYDDLLYLDIQINAVVIGVCSYSLEDVELKLNIKDQIVFSDNEDDEETYYCKDNIIDLDEYILGILLANVPVKIVKKGAKLPKGGNDYRVITEEEYEQEKKKQPDPRWAKLDSVQIPDDED